MKNTLEQINNKLDEEETQIIDLEDKVPKTPNQKQTNKQKKNRKKGLKNEYNLRNLWDNIQSNICMIEYQKEKREREQRI